MTMIRIQQQQQQQQQLHYYEEQIYTMPDVHVDTRCTMPMPDYHRNNTDTNTQVVMYDSDSYV
eukprot:CAMPEP_0170777236 /NCGR_PEP_ID=MMETSP0733-20121128/11659_1 /TAXON_ID=186038 /ORGANISM="Fragilariopsis kerguelensis, Strain L26-C5" /LENGTH=62 /DNA_ID=CAMNT_0011120397 /DNA_START=483 /DNA_END=671 /DNA_ORIENTATION=+